MPHIEKTPRSRDRTTRRCCCERHGKPERPGQERRVHVVVMYPRRHPIPKSAHRPVGRRREARVVTSQRCGMRQKIVPDEHRLGATQMCVGRHERDTGTPGLVCARSHECSHGRLQHRNAPTQIEAQIERDLFVADRALYGGVARRLRYVRSACARRNCEHPVRSRHERRVAAPSFRMALSPSTMARVSCPDRTPAAPRASVHAMLPMTSSSNSARSNPKDTPKSNASGSRRQSAPTTRS